MRLRLFGLLVVAGACTWLGAWVSTAGAEKTPAAALLTTARPAPAAGRCPLPARYRATFDQAARDTQLPLALLAAVARVESNIRTLDPNHPPSNILADARYLRLMLDRFHSTDLALAAYNAGPTAVTRAGGAPSAEVLTYVANVTALWRRLNGCK
jgi:soluble lytic murein transglycosylase-like protein